MHAVNSPKPDITPSNTHSSNSQPSNKTQSSPQVAEVVHAQRGEALEIRQENGTLLKVDAHASMVPSIDVGDRVIFIPSHSSESTAAIIVDRLRKPGESPVKTFTEEDDHLVLETDKHILLKNPKTLFALTADGSLSISAENILTLAKALYSIKGQNVEIN